MKASQGVLVSDVAKNSPAYKSGIVAGDVIIDFNAKMISDVGMLRNLVAQSKIGSEAAITLVRQGKELLAKVAIVELPYDAPEPPIRPAPGSDALINSLSGLTVTDISPALAKQLGLDKDDKGVVILRIETGTSADDAGLHKGDLIQEIDRQRVTNLTDFNRTLSKLTSDESVLLFVNRSGRKFYVTLEPR
jgi:serine protease Do